jgi:hypothetical protein
MSSVQFASYISRMLSSQSLSTRDLSYARVDYISRFLQKNSLEFKYIILDETVMKRRGKRIENLGKFYSTIENRIVSGVSLLSAIGWVKDKLYLHSVCLDYLYELFPHFFFQ